MAEFKLARSTLPVAQPQSVRLHPMAESPKPPPSKLPTGLRVPWLGSSLLLLCTLSFPWSSCKSMTPMGLALTTLSGGTGEVYLVLGSLLLLPVALLTFWTSLETRPLRAQDAQLPTRVGLPLALSIVSLGLSLFARGSPYRAWPSEAHVWLQLLLCGPLGMFLAFALLVSQGPGMATLGRAVVLHFVASVVLLWSPMCNAVGFKLAVPLVAVLMVLGPWLEDHPAAPRPVQRGLAGLAVLWVLAAGLVSWPHRRAFEQQIEERAAIPFVVGSACCLPGAKPSREALAQRP